MQGSRPPLDFICLSAADCRVWSRGLRALLPFANMVRLVSKGSFYQRYVEATCGRLVEAPGIEAAAAPLPASVDEEVLVL